LNREPLENSCRPSVDVLFRSVAAAYRERTLAIVLTGIGSDGKKGCELIRQNGGKVIAQDEATSVVWGMPGAVTKAGLANCVLPLPEISKQLSRLQQPSRLMATAGH
jgi:two-component system chemotaxis response regulator CheB